MNQKEKAKSQNIMKTILTLVIASGILALPISSAQACSCGGKEKCKACCGEKCSDCTKDCCKK